MSSIAVAVTGAGGRMGQEVVRAVLAQPDMRLVAAVDTANAGADVGELAGAAHCGVTVRTDLDGALRDHGAAVLVDFTRGDAAPNNVLTAIAAGLHAVVGTTGIEDAALQRMDLAARQAAVGVLVAPNFALGAVLMMRFAQEAARYYEWAEIIELHHEKKLDAPSGTALRTADLMSAARAEFKSVDGETEKLPGVRGGLRGGVRVHSVRLAGLVAHQEVLLGGAGETLTLRHDSLSRLSFMPGVMLAVRRVHQLQGLAVGLEHVM